MRLRDYDENDPQMIEAARLTRAADPGEPGPFLAQKVERALAKPRRRRGVPRWSMALGVLLVGAFAAAAAWRSHRREVPVVPLVPLVPPVALEHTDVIVPHDEVPAPKTSAPVVPHRHHVEHVTTPSAAPEPTESDAMLLQRATRAWKHDHDASTAAALADEHLRTFTTSDLREEAFSISMSAHEALADGNAKAVARRYVAQFPTGRFLTQAAALTR